MAPRRTALQRTHRVALVVLGGLLLVLVGTGVWLAFRYQPSGTFRGARPESWVRETHRTASRLFVFAALAAFAFSIAVSVERALKRGFPVWVLGLAIVLAALLASFSGYLLPWDQLALPFVRANSEYRGFAFLFGHAEVKFVMIGSAIVRKRSVLGWFLAHTVAIPIVLSALGVVGWRVTRRSRLLPPTEVPER